MARVDEPPADRDTQPLTLHNFVDCEGCGCVFEHVYQAPPGIFEIEDLVDAPVEAVTCPSCGEAWERPYEGWLSHEDAG